MQRRSQAERRAATRRALIDAAEELLVEQGWAQVTSVGVCARAGLTRGAFVHHFDGLPDLFAAVLVHRYDEIATRIEAEGEANSIVELVDRTWLIASERQFKVVLEAWLAGANDPDLAHMLRPVIANFAKLIGPDRWPDLLADEAARSFYLAAREAVLGLAWGLAVNRGVPMPHQQLVLDHLSTTAATHDARLGH